MRFEYVFRYTMKKISLLICFTSIVLLAQAQKEFANWYFGNGAAMAFQNGQVETLTGSSLYTDEGCTSVSDDSGKLLFYTNGVTVWDNTHEVMINGNGLNGHRSATQSALIVRKPGASYLYYLFTVDEKGGKNGLSYSTIDMRKRGGKGEVTRKNLPLVTPATEKLIAVPHPNGESIWVIAHQWTTNRFFIYQVDAKGISKPKISAIGTVHKDVGSGNNGEAIGQMKISPNGKKLALVTCYKANQNLEIFDFDTRKGAITGGEVYNTRRYAYGVEFSPDNSKLYVSFLQGSAGLVQYDLSTGRNLLSSEKIVARYDGTPFGSLQLGPDGNIYVARTSNYVDAVFSPNSSNCSYQSKRVQLGDVYCAYGLPNPPVQTGPKKAAPPAKKPGPPKIKPIDQVETPAPKKVETWTVNLGGDTSVCADKYLLDPGIEGAVYKWSNGSREPTLTVFSDGNYAVTVTYNGRTKTDKANVRFRGAPTRFSYLPAFTPGANLNGLFDFTLRNVTEFELTVKDAKGKVVYYSTDVEQRWKGMDKKKNPLPAGEYFWEFKYRPICPNNDRVTKTGKVLLKS